jgi:predicted RNA-binding Zn ribbon-like protein
MAGHSSAPATGDASGELLAIEFANTRYAERGTLRDGLATPEMLTAWLEANTGRLAAAGAPDAVRTRLGDCELAAFVELRDTISGLIASAVGGEPLAPAQVASLNEVARTAPSWPILMVGPAAVTVVEHSPEPTAAALLGAIARSAVRLLGGAAQENLRACRAPGCVQYFVKDHPRREWCCAACGNRARVARHYLRHHGNY